MFELTQDFGEIRTNVGRGRFGYLLRIPGVVASPGCRHKSLVSKHTEGLLHGGWRDAEAARQLPYGAYFAAGLDDSIPDLTPQGLGCLFVGLSGVVLSDRHAFERTH